MDPATHPRRYVGLRVAATWLGIDPRTLGKFLDAHLLPFHQFAGRRKIAVIDLVAFEAKSKRHGLREERQNAPTRTS